MWAPEVNESVFNIGADIIIQQVNCVGVMGAGLAKQIRLRFPGVYDQYKAYCGHHNGARALLGEIQVVVNGEGEPLVVNLFAQVQFGRDRRYTDYDAFRTCCKKLAKTLETLDENAVVAIPYGIGCGLAGGDWGIISGILHDTLGDLQCQLVVCNYKP